MICSTWRLEPSPLGYLGRNPGGRAAKWGKSPSARIGQRPNSERKGWLTLDDPGGGGIYLIATDSAAAARLRKKWAGVFVVARGDSGVVEELRWMAQGVERHA